MVPFHVPTLLVFAITQLVACQPPSPVAAECESFDDLSLLQPALLVSTGARARESPNLVAAGFSPARSRADASNGSELSHHILDGPGYGEEVQPSVLPRKPPLSNAPAILKGSPQLPLLSNTSVIWILMLLSAILAVLVRAASPGLNVMWFVLGATGGIAYAAPIPQSYDLTVAHGGSATFSGMLVSVVCMSGCVGSVVGWVINGHVAVRLRDSLIVMYCIVGVNIGAFWIFAASESTSQYILLLLRFLHGVFWGLFSYWRDLLKPVLLHDSQIQSAMLWETIGTCVGLGIGPMASGLGEFAFGALQFNDAPKLAAASCYFSLLLIFPVCSILHSTIPADLQTDSQDEQAAAVALATIGPISAVQSLSRKVIVSSLAVTTLANFSLQSIEVGSALLLELEYGMPTKMIGLAIGVALICVLPVAGVLGVMIESADTSAQSRYIKILYWGVFVACLLFVPLRFLGNLGWLPILIGDSMAFSFVATSMGMLSGAMLLATKEFSSHSMWSWSNVAVFSQILFSARSISGPLTRALIDFCTHHWALIAGGQLGYSIFQIITSLVILVTVYYFASVTGKYSPTVSQGTKDQDTSCQGASNHDTSSGQP